MKMVQMGSTNQEIKIFLVVSLATAAEVVKNHFFQIFTKKSNMSKTDHSTKKYYISN